MLPMRVEARSLDENLERLDQSSATGLGVVYDRPPVYRSADPAEIATYTRIAYLSITHRKLQKGRAQKNVTGLPPGFDLSIMSSWKRAGPGQ